MTTKLVYILGGGRSGTTFLDQLLGSVPSAVSIGEARHFFERIQQFDRRCGCGSPVPYCPLWSKVASVLSLPGEDLDAYADFQRRSLRSRFIGRLIRGDDEPTRAYRATLGALYEAVAEASDATMVVDSSKRAADAAVVDRLESVDAYFIHLVRDPRAVGYSWSKRRVDPDTADGSLFPRLPPRRSAVSWATQNLAVEWFRTRCTSGRVLRMRYEDIVAEPAARIAEVVRFLDLPASANPLGAGNVIDLAVSHAILGNSSRFRNGPTEVYVDQTWRSQVTVRQRLWASLAGGPLMVRYGYPVARLGSVVERTRP